MERFAEVHGSRMGPLSVPGRPYLHHNKRTELLESGSGSDTSPIPGRSSPVPFAAISLPRSYISPTSAKRRQSLALGVPHAQTAEAISLHALDLFEGQHRVGDEPVIAEHRVIEAPSHPDSVEPRTKTVGDVLRHAARIIEERGWCQTSFENETGARCALGAVAAAAGAPPISWLPAWEGVSAEAKDFLDNLAFIDREHGERFYIWNDTPGRTAAEVISALRAAADEADR